MYDNNKKFFKWLRIGLNASGHYEIDFNSVKLQ